MASTYPVTCSCGVVTQVTATQAGSILTCPCGKSVEIPSLGRLKSSVGESAASVNFEILHLLETKALPLERECYRCHTPTDSVRTVLVMHESERLENDDSAKTGCLLAVMFGPLIGLFWLLTFGMRKRWGGSQLALPIRVCERCSKNLKSRDDAVAALNSSTLYSRLLQKYPEARVRLAAK